MQNVAMLKAIKPSEAHTEIAVVQGGESVFMVNSSIGLVKANVAFSCLVMPQQGDRVLLSSSDKENYILAIIDRQNSVDMSLSFPGNVDMAATSGSIKFAAGHSVAFTSAKKVQLASPELSISSVNVNVMCQKALVKGESLTSHWEHINSVSKLFQFMTDTLTQRMKNTFKKVDGMEQKSSQNYSQTIEKTVTMRSRDAVITARKDIKIDGERIHMG